jgi:hypothetical protein
MFLKKIRASAAAPVWKLAKELKARAVTRKPARTEPGSSSRRVASPENQSTATTYQLLHNIPRLPSSSHSTEVHRQTIISDIYQATLRCVRTDLATASAADSVDRLLGGVPNPPR